MVNVVVAGLGWAVVGGLIFGCARWIASERRFFSSGRVPWRRLD